MVSTPRIIVAISVAVSLIMCAMTVYHMGKGIPQQPLPHLLTDDVKVSSTPVQQLRGGGVLASFPYVNWCPLGFSAPKITHHDELTAIEGYGTEAQQLYDMSPSATPTTTAPPTSTVAPEAVSSPPTRPPPLIPRVIVQVSSRDSVPRRMRAAMFGIRHRHPQYEHRYFSDRSSRRWMKQNADPGTWNAYQRLAHESVRAQLFIWTYLLRNGGVYMAPNFSPVEEQGIGFHRVALESSAFVCSVSPNGQISADFVATAPNSIVLRTLLAFVVPRIAWINFLEIQDASRPPHVDAIAGSVALTEAVIIALRTPEMAGEDASKLFNATKPGKDEEAPAPAWSPLSLLPNTTVTTVEPGVYPLPVDPSNATIVIHGRLLKPECELGTIWNAINFSAVMGQQPRAYLTDGAPEGPPESKVEPLEMGQSFLYTSYPGFVKDRLWYRMELDEPQEAFIKETLFRDFENDIMCNVSSVFYINARYTTRPQNQIPEESRMLLDIAPYHPPRVGYGHLRSSSGERLTYTTKIPLRIMQTNKADQLPKNIRKAVQWVMIENPEFEYYYFSDDRIREFIQQHFDAATLKAFDDVLPGAFKSDLFRYCFLYVFGGVYLDTDFIPETPLRNLLLANPEAEFISAEDCGSGGIHNGFMAATPRHPYIKAAVDRAVKNINDRYYGFSELEITGPTMLKRIWSDFAGEAASPDKAYKDGKVKLIRFACGPCGHTIESNGVVYLRGPFSVYVAEMRWYGSANFLYFDRWRKGTVFAGDNDLYDRRREEEMYRKIDQYHREMGIPVPPRNWKTTPSPSHPQHLRNWGLLQWAMKQ